MKEDKWLSELGTWLRKQRPSSGLWTDIGVNHDWTHDQSLPSVEAPMLFLMASPTINPTTLLAEAIRRLETTLPDSDRIPAGVVPFIRKDGKSYAVILKLDDFIDILTDSVLGEHGEISDLHDFIKREIFKE